MTSSYVIADGVHTSQMIVRGECLARGAVPPTEGSGVPLGGPVPAVCGTMNMGSSPMSAWWSRSMIPC